MDIKWTGSIWDSVCAEGSWSLGYILQESMGFLIWDYLTYKYNYFVNFMLEIVLSFMHLFLE